jgi:contact-dependent growth inhibition (CDI) system CdiI-like immunity protein
MSLKPALRQLLRAYFTQDFPEIYGDPWQVVEAFAREPSLAPMLGSEIDEVLAANPTEPELKHLIIDEYDSSYLPEADGWTYRAWLTEVARRVEEILATRD